jgi:hypothetical protein
MKAKMIRQHGKELMVSTNSRASYELFKSAWKMIDLMREIHSILTNRRKSQERNAQ